MRSLSVLLALSSLTACDEGGGEAPPGPDGVPVPPIVDHQPLTPISGGTLAITPDGTRAVAADPEGHRIFVVDLEAGEVRGTLAVPEGEPGRVVLDDTHAWVALRTQGVARIELARATQTHHFTPCDTPRGLALDGDALHVACADGELVTLAAADGTERRRVALEPDLRDVVVGGPDRLYVTTFRSASVLVVEGGRPTNRWHARSLRPEDGAHTAARPNVAWRTIGLPDGRLAMLHQRAQLSRVTTSVEGGYGTTEDPCAGAIVTPAITVFGPDGTIERDGLVPSAVLAVDLAAHPDSSLSLAAPGSPGLAAQHIAAFEGANTCLPGMDVLGVDMFGFTQPFTAVALDARGTLWAQSRHPLALVGGGRSILLGDSQEDTGHTLFHQDAGGGIACASCHPEGGDDGHTWLFEQVGLRRTQHLRGGLIGREPFHWEGDLQDIGALMDEVMVKRMGGQPLTPQHADRLLSWIDAQPVIHLKPTDPTDAITRGEALFQSLACTTCHTDGTGDGRTYDVGTGGYFQVPTLQGLALRAPYLHDGCAATLHDRFGPCGGGDQHGVTSTLHPAEVDDLVAFLKTL